MFSNGTDEGAKGKIAQIVGGRLSDSIEYKFEPEKKGSDGSEGSAGETALEKQIKSNPALQFYLGLGGHDTITIMNKSNVGLYLNVNYMPLTDS